MNMTQIKNLLAELPKSKPALASHKNGNICLIVNAENNNIGYDIALDYNSLKIEKFQREPYRTCNVSNGFERLTVKQLKFVRNYLIENYMHELNYLLQ